MVKTVLSCFQWCAIISTLLWASIAARADTTVNFDGLELPSCLFDAVWSDATNFEANQKGNGSGISYYHPQRKIDVFVYRSQGQGTVVQRIAKEMANLDHVMEGMVQRGYYRDVKIGDIRTERIYGVDFAFRSVSFIADGKRKISGYFLAPFGELIVKTRVTSDATDTDIVSGLAFQPYVEAVAQVIASGKRGRSI